MTTPTTPDLPEARVRAAAFGRRFVRSMTARTRSRVAGDTEPPLMTLETVARETPLKDASSSSVPATDPPVLTDGSALTLGQPQGLSNRGSGRHESGIASGVTLYAKRCGTRPCRRGGRSLGLVVDAEPRVGIEEVDT